MGSIAQIIRVASSHKKLPTESCNTVYSLFLEQGLSAGLLCQKQLSAQTLLSFGNAMVL